MILAHIDPNANTIIAAVCCISLLADMPAKNISDNQSQGYCPNWNGRNSLENESHTDCCAECLCKPLLNFCDLSQSGLANVTSELEVPFCATIYHHHKECYIPNNQVIVTTPQMSAVQNQYNGRKHNNAAAANAIELYTLNNAVC